MEIVDLTPEIFEETVQSPGLVLVDCWAGWCGPCKAFAPTFEAAARAHPKHRFAKLDTDAHPALRGALEIESLPTLLVYRDGILMFHEPGAHSAEDVNGMIEQAMSVNMKEVRATIAAAAGA